MTVGRVEMVKEGRRIGSREVTASTTATRVDTPAERERGRKKAMSELSSHKKLELE